MEQQLERDMVLGRPEDSHQQSKASKSETLEKSVSYIKQFDWQIQQFSEDDALKRFSELANEHIDLNQKIQQQNSVHVAETSTKSSAFSKVTLFIVRGSDNIHENIEVVRKYSDFFELREALVRRWPGCFIPPIPELGNIGITDKQINKNKVELINNFLAYMRKNEHIYGGQQFVTFFKSPENIVSQNLIQLKSKPYSELLKQYKEIWPNHFQQLPEEHLKNYQERIRKIENYFTEMKYDLAHQKNQLKRLAQLRAKLDVQRFNVLEKLLPEYENICMNWFYGLKGKEGNDKKEAVKEEGEEQKEQEISDRIYSSLKYQNVLQGYRDQIVPEQNLIWSLYQLFKFEQRQIDSLLQAITQYRYIINDRKFYVRNIENNTQQLEDINNNRVSIKILMLSGSEDQKKTQLANQTEQYEKQLKMLDELFSGVTCLVLEQIEDFQSARCQFYKKKMIETFKKEAIYMGKLFNLYVETQRI